MTKAIAKKSVEKIYIYKSKHHEMNINKMLQQELIDICDQP